MPEELIMPIMVATGTEADHAAVSTEYLPGQFSFTSADAKRTRIGNEDGTAHLIGANGGNASIVPSTAGTTELSLASGFRRHIRKIAPAAGAGAYVRKYTLPAAESGGVDVLDYDEVIVRVQLPASANPSVEIYNESTAGTLLVTVTGNASAARTWLFHFVRFAGVWELWATNEILF